MAEQRNVIEYLFRGKDEVSGSLDRVSGALGLAAKAVGALAAGFAAVGVGKFVQQQINAADELGKMSQKSGVAVESLSRLQHAFLLNEVDAAGLNNAFRFLNRSIESAASGNKTAEASFSALGLSLSDIKNSSPDEVLLKVADAFSKSEDGSGKAAIAMRLFGRAGVDMIPALNEGRAGISKLTQEADRLGLTVSKEFAREADEFNDSMTRIQQGTAGAGRSVAKALLPVLNETMDALGAMFASTESAIPWSKIIGTAAAAIATALLGIVGAAKQVYIAITGTFGAIGTAIGGVMAAVVTAATGDLKSAFDILKQAGSDSGAAFVKMAQDEVQASKEMADGISQVWEGLGRLESGVTAVGEATKEANKNKLSVVDPGAEEALDKLRIKQQEYLSALSKDEAASRNDRLTMLETEYQARLAKLDELGFQGAERAKAEVALEGWVSQERLNIKRSMLDQLGIADAEYRAMSEQAAADQAQRMIEAGLTEAQADQFLKTTLLEQQLAYQEARRTAIGEDNLTNAEIALLNYEEENLRLQTALAQKLITKEQYDAAEQAAEIKKQVALGSIQAKYEQNRLMVSKMTLDQQVSYYGNMMGQLGSLMSSKSEKMFKVGKAAAIASATISTYQAVANGLATSPFMPMGIAMGALALINGMQQISAIKSTQFQGQAHAGMTNVPKEGTYMLDKGERVLSPDQNTDLEKFMDKGGSGGGGGPITITNLVIHVLENATSADALLNMPERTLQELIAAKFIPALNALNDRGVRPEFVQKYAR